MRILVNGYYYGGNCPPYVWMLKSINPETKLTNALSILDDHGMNTDYLNKEDIIDIPLNFIEKIFVLFTKKARLPFWKTILVKKAKQIVRDYRPDIIINHKASEKAEIMLKTGFRPQLTLIYGSEVHQNRVHRKKLDYIFDESSYILTTTQHMQSYLERNRGSWKEKIKVYPMGNFDFEKIFQYKKENSMESIRRKHGFGSNEMIILENRSLRGEHSGFFSIIKALKILNRKAIQVKMIIMKGIGGTDHMAQKLQAIINEDLGLANQIVFINEVLDNDRLFDYYFLADAFVSLLPADQMGKCISDAMLFDCSLILSDLDVYRKRFGNGPSYIKDQNADQLAKTLVNLKKGRRFKVESDVYENLLKVSQPRVQFAELHGFIDRIVREK